MLQLALDKSPEVIRIIRLQTTGGLHARQLPQHLQVQENSMGKMESECLASGGEKGGVCHGVHSPRSAAEERAATRMTSAGKMSFCCGCNSQEWAYQLLTLMPKYTLQCGGSQLLHLRVVLPVPSRLPDKMLHIQLPYRSVQEPELIVPVMKI
uniref:Uncharacterized protein n=1 Tax=Physcomitrium patens TaxID=3218 RepID=A0A2K1L459_PHYPA|nr:hypothetical protein PHYPA_003605 [Physcomitrium patens]